MTNTNPVGQVAGFLSDLAKTASKDAALPMFTVIRLHTDSGVLHGWSTDRYRAAHATAPVFGSLSEPVFLARPDAEAAAKALRKAAVVEVSNQDGKATFSGDGVALTYATLDVGWLTVSNGTKAFPEQLPTEHKPVRFQSGYLADFAAIAKRRGEFVDLVPAVGMRPTAIRIGNEYRAWLMPLNTVGREGEITWLSHSWDGAE